MRGNGYGYALVNLAASALVLLSLVKAFNLPSAITQIIWIVISVTGLLRQAILAWRARLAEEERNFIEAKFPTMTPSVARRFLDRGEWRDAGDGTTLVSEGARLGGLVFLSRGRADIVSKGQTIAQCGPGDFIGEMSCFDGSKASATVTLREPSRYFFIRTEALKLLCAHDLDISRPLENSIGRDIRLKLIATNTGLSAAREALASQGDI